MRKNTNKNSFQKKTKPTLRQQLTTPRSRKHMQSRRNQNYRHQHNKEGTHQLEKTDLKQEYKIIALEIQQAETQREHKQTGSVTTVSCVHTKLKPTKTPTQNSAKISKKKTNTGKQNVHLARRVYISFAQMHSPHNKRL